MWKREGGQKGKDPLLLLPPLLPSQNKTLIFTVRDRITILIIYIMRDIFTDELSKVPSPQPQDADKLIEGESYNITFNAKIPNQCCLCTLPLPSL